MSEKCRDNNKHNSNNSVNPLTSRRNDGGKNSMQISRNVFLGYKKNYIYHF